MDRKEQLAGLMELMTSMTNTLNAKLFEQEAKLTGLSKKLQEIKAVRTEVSEVKDEVDNVWNRVLAKTVDIYGMKTATETMDQLEFQVKSMAHKLGVAHLDVDVIRRMGKYKPEKIA